MVRETFEKVSERKTTMGPGELIIRLKEAKLHKGHDFMCLGRADVYAAFSLGGEKRNSKVIEKAGSHPVWDERLSFKLAPHVKFELYGTLHVSLFEEDIGQDDLRGTAKIDIESLLREHENEVPFGIYPIYQKNRRQRGTVELAFSFIPNFNKKTLRHFFALED